MLRAITFNGTPITPSSISLPSGGSFDLYNTADQTTNYERLRERFLSNVGRLALEVGGTGDTNREFQIGHAGVADNNTITTGISFKKFNVTEAWTAWVASTSAAGPAFKFTSGGGNFFNASSGTQTVFGVNPAINQSGTAGYTALDINPTESATGSGTKLLQRWATGGTERGRVDNNGNIWATSFTSVNSGFGFGTAFGSAGDVILARDAAATLAQRNGTNAQAFRVYKTYTDASNYERLDINWSGSQCFIGAAFAGTGSGRELQFVSYGSAAFTLTATAHMALAAGTTARSQINFASSTAPTSPADGDLWFDGTNLKLRVSGATYTITKT